MPQPPQRDVKVNGQSGTIFKDTDPPIYLLYDGRFAMKFGGLWKVRGSIKPLMAMIGKFGSALKLTQLHRIYETVAIDRLPPEVIEAVSWDRGVIGFKDGKRKKARYSDWYLYDKDIDAKIKVVFRKMHGLDLAHARAMRGLVAEYNRLRGRLKVMNEGNFVETLAGIDDIRPRGRAKNAKA